MTRFAVAGVLQSTYDKIARGMADSRIGCRINSPSQIYEGTFENRGDETPNAAKVAGNALILPKPFFFAATGAILSGAIAMQVFAFAAAVRTERPNYRMTFGRFWGVTGYTLLSQLLTSLAGLAFVIPAYWVGPKVLFMPCTYALTDGSAGA